MIIWVEQNIYHIDNGDGDDGDGYGDGDDGNSDW